jgi:hypothetical protein
MTTNLLNYEYLCLTSPWRIKNGPKFGQLRWRNHIDFRAADTRLLGDHKGMGVPIPLRCLKSFPTTERKLQIYQPDIMRE